jgi:two-component system sensor histidine kinase HydH
MGVRKEIAKNLVIIVLVLSISLVNYLSPQNDPYYHSFAQELYYLPLILAAFWFGMKGAVVATAGITAVYVPFIILMWRGCSPEDFIRLMELVSYLIVGGSLGILRNREEKKQKRLREAESLAGIGRAMSGVAHDMKTPLIAIGGFTSMVMKKFQENDSNYEKLSIVLKETQRMEKLVKDMLDFSRPLEIQRSMEDLQQIVSETLAVTANTADKHKVKVTSQVPQTLSAVSLDVNRMKQVLINLLVNAIQASPEGGSVKLQVYPEGKSLIIDVSDSGSGIPAEKKEEIFLPFVTTKKEGTGLGLCIVKKIVEAHDGYLRIVDNNDRGVTFRVVIPMR